MQPHHMPRLRRHDPGHITLHQNQVPQRRLIPSWHVGASLAGQTWPPTRERSKENVEQMLAHPLQCSRQHLHALVSLGYCHRNASQRAGTEIPSPWGVLKIEALGSTAPVETKSLKAPTNTSSKVNTPGAVASSAHNEHARLATRIFERATGWLAVISRTHVRTTGTGCTRCASTSMAILHSAQRASDPDHGGGGGGGGGSVSG